MSDYNLDSTRTHEFESIVQALATNIIDNGGVTLGDGPDGGRELTFDGKMGNAPKPFQL
mgnify:FL=1|jgi:hypothetical protein|tara:strand:+ start:91 stop:267 length:177 start_codon:yes stop_codon:yes gene_type:complete